MGESVVTFKATVNGLIIIMRQEDDFQAVYEQVEKKIEQAGRFFKGASINVRYRGKKLLPDEEQMLLRLLVEKSGAEVRALEEEAGEFQDAQDNPDTGDVKVKIKRPSFNDINEGMTKFYRGTVRSGQLISFEGNLVIIGDVNPGGEVVATGNVVVMGSLRGMAFAGSDGNKEAVVAALNLQPVQLRIAEIITRSPDEKELRGSFIPEIAFVREDAIYIEKYLPQR